MAKLYATLETSKGKTVSVSDNEEIIATVYDGNMKAYSVHISWTNLGDIEEPTMGAIITTREWRNEPEERRKQDERCKDCIVRDMKFCNHKQVKATGEECKHLITTAIYKDEKLQGYECVSCHTRLAK